VATAGRWEARARRWDSGGPKNNTSSTRHVRGRNGNADACSLRERGMKARPGARGELLVTVGRRRRFSPESSPADLTTLRPSSRQHARTPGACLEIPAPTIEAATTAPVRACRGGEMYFFRRRPASPSILCRVLLRTGAHQCSSRERFREMGGARTVYYAGLVDPGRPVAAWPTSHRASTNTTTGGRSVRPGGCPFAPPRRGGPAFSSEGGG